MVTAHTLDEGNFYPHRMRPWIKLFKGRAQDKMGDDPEAERQRSGCVRLQCSFVDLQTNTGRRFWCIESVEGRSIGLFTWNKIGELFEDQPDQQGSLPAGPGGYQRPEQMGPNSFGFPLSVPFQGHLINACQLSDTPAFVEVANAQSE